MIDSSQGHEPEHFRTLVHEPEYDQAVANIFRSVRRADEALIGLELWISCRAEMGLAYKPSSAPNVATWLTKPLPEGRIRVLYSYDNDTAYLLDAWLVPNPPDTDRYG